METKEIIGRNPVLEYLRALEDSQGAELFISETAHGKIIDVILGEARRRRVKVTQCDRATLSRAGSSSHHQGVMLRVSGPASRTGDLEFIQEVASRGGVIVALDQLSDPHNIGSIIRTTEALGGDAVALPKAHTSEITPTVIKASAGATAHLRVMNVANLARFLDQCRDAGFTVLGAAGEGDTPVTGIGEFRPAVLVIGSEGEGMRRLTMEKCDRMVSIPLRGNVGSLNASVAAAIILYELLKD